MPRLGHVQVEVLAVEAVHHLVLQNTVELGEIDHHSHVRIHRTGDGHGAAVVMRVTRRLAQRAERVPVPGLAPVGAVEAVYGAKARPSGSGKSASSGVKGAQAAGTSPVQPGYHPMTACPATSGSSGPGIGQLPEHDAGVAAQVNAVGQEDADTGVRSKGRTCCPARSPVSRRLPPKVSPTPAPMNGASRCQVLPPVRLNWRSASTNVTRLVHRARHPVRHLDERVHDQALQSALTQAAARSGWCFRCGCRSGSHRPGRRGARSRSGPPSPAKNPPIGVMVWPLQMSR